MLKVSEVFIMEFNDKKEYAVYLKHNGYNCTQAVLMAYQNEIGLDEEIIKKLGSSFGSGMGGMKGTCGALIGANIALGLLNTTSLASKFHAKDIVDEFEQKSKALTCQDIKGLKTHVILTSCEDCIRNAIDILNKKLESFNE
jgi:C_GCAxxG_C_C family probable redox protein